MVLLQMLEKNQGTSGALILWMCREKGEGRACGTLEMSILGMQPEDRRGGTELGKIVLLEDVQQL